MSIYNSEVLETTHTLDLVPRTLDEQLEYIRTRSGGLAILVAETDDPEGPDVIAGFGSLSFYRDRPGYRTSVENSVYVHKDFRNQGVGSFVMEGLIAQARQHGFHSMLARIPGAQEASVRLHTKLGFELIGVEREVGRKFNKFLDVAVLQLLL